MQTTEDPRRALRSRRWPAAAIALTALFTALLPAQEPSSRPADSKRDGPEQLEEWPSLDKDEEGRVKALIRALEKDDEETRDAAIAELDAIGLRATEVVLRMITPRKAEAHPPLCAFLDRVTGPEHVDLILEEVEDKRVSVRRWATRRLAWLHAEAATEAFAERIADDKDEQVQFYAALGLTGLGDWEHFDLVFEMAQKDFNGVEKDLSAVLATQCSGEATERVVKRIDRKKAGTAIAALRLMRTLTPKTRAAIPASFLDAPEAQIKREAINTLRVIVDGDEPNDLSAFQLINATKKWKERVR